MDVSYNRANGFSALASFVLDSKDINTNQLQYSIIEYSTPESTLGSIALNRNSTQGSIPGDTVVDEQNTLLRFIVDEDLKVYFDLKSIQKNNASNGISKDILNISLMNNHHKVIAKGIYYGAWIGNISPLRYTVIENETTVFLDVNLNFLRYELQPLGT